LGPLVSAGSSEPPERNDARNAHLGSEGHARVRAVRRLVRVRQGPVDGSDREVKAGNVRARAKIGRESARRTDGRTLRFESERPRGRDPRTSRGLSRTESRNDRDRVRRTHGKIASAETLTFL